MEFEYTVKSRLLRGSPRELRRSEAEQASEFGVGTWGLYVTRRAEASTYVLRHLTTQALDFGTEKRRSTPVTEYDFESEREDKEDLSPNNENGPKFRRRG